MRRRGISLLELLLVVTLSAMIAVSVSGAYNVVLKNETRAPEIRAVETAQRALESRITNLLRSAFVDDDQANAATYFIARSDPESSSGISPLQDEAATEIIFTTLDGAISGQAGAPSTDSFEQRNEDIGPAGGVHEIRLGTVAVGDVADQVGLFIREQVPSDGDPEQGGFESVLDSAVTSISFEMWNGTEWITAWDTQTGDRRLPSAVRVTYQVPGAAGGDDSVTRRFTVRLPGSDVTSANPDTAQQGTGTGT